MRLLGWETEQTLRAKKSHTAQARSGRRLPLFLPVRHGVQRPEYAPGLAGAEAAAVAAVAEGVAAALHVAQAGVRVRVLRASADVSFPQAWHSNAATRKRSKALALISMSCDRCPRSGARTQSSTRSWGPTAASKRQNCGRSTVAFSVKC